MSLGVGLSLLLVAALRAARWWLRRTDALGRRNPFPTIAVGACALLASISLAVGMEHRHTEHRLAGAASVLVGAPVTVHCQTLAEAWVDVGPELGYVRFGAGGVPEHRTLLKWDTCRHLASWLRSDRRHPTLEQVVAVHVLTHESMHMAGSRNEAVAECRAVQRDARTADLLGATSQQGRRLAVRYWQAVYPWMGEDYRTSDCAPGGRLDEHLPDPPWGN